MKIQLPQSKRKKALVLVDIQPQTLNDKVKPVVEKIRRFVAATDYDLYIDANYHADKKSMFYRQGKWMLTAKKTGKTDADLCALLCDKKRAVVHVQKNTRSIFKTPKAKALLKALKQNRITELHFVGFDINACVLASAYDAFDLGYYSVVIEELCHHNKGRKNLVDAALEILRWQTMTNNSTKLPVKTVTI